MRSAFLLLHILQICIGKVIFQIVPGKIVVNHWIDFCHGAFGFPGAFSRRIIRAKGKLMHNITSDIACPNIKRS